ncbi:hypothetical protein [Mycobacterium sp. 141]|uniref:hypothetical protein n=1 Tax=Mycobacterium sp. 141 TaxID=1120797 RepID=UPI00036C7D13|nr:hypothetical protein [Mycobacterium sp. 141]
MNWDLLVAELATPSLPGARCHGRHELFDAAIDNGQRGHQHDREYARNAALRLCAQCPAWRLCRDWFDSLPADQRPLGVTAGLVVNGKP